MDGIESCSNGEQRGFKAIGPGHVCHKHDGTPDSIRRARRRAKNDADGQKQKEQSKKQ